MANLLRTSFAGVAIGGFAATVIGANKIVLQTLWKFNVLAIETAVEMAFGFAALRSYREVYESTKGNTEDEV